jgi:hypothetical protein
MQAEIYPGRTSGVGQDRPLVDVEPVRIDDHARMQPPQRLGAAPMHGGAPSVGQPGLDEHEHARADRQQPRALRVRAPDCREDERRHEGLRTAPVRNGDRAGP